MKAKITHRNKNNNPRSELVFTASMTESEAKERAKRNARIIVGYQVI